MPLLMQRIYNLNQRGSYTAIVTVMLMFTQWQWKSARLEQRTECRYVIMLLFRLGRRNGLSTNSTEGDLPYRIQFGR